MSKATPGPWRLMENPDYPSLIGVEMSNGKEVGYIAAKSEPEEVANARLISASPELLEALKMVLAVADRNTKEFDAARAAIAKAEGES